MSFKSDQGINETNLDKKHSLKHSFLSNFKSSKSKSKTKISSSPSDGDLKPIDKSTLKSLDGDELPEEDMLSSDIYPLSTYTRNSSSLDYTSFRKNHAISVRKENKLARQKPIVTAFMNGSSFSSSTSSSPPSPRTYYSHAHRQSRSNRVNQAPMHKEQEEKEQEETEINTQHRSRSKPKYHDKLRSKVTAGVCTASTSISLNSDYDEEDFMDAFRVFDIDGDGRITDKELKLVLKELGIKMSKSDIKKMIKELDKDGNGTIEYSGEYFLKKFSFSK